MSLLAVGVAIWTLAFVGAGVIAGPVGIVVATMFFVTAMVLGVAAQRDLADKYVVIRKDEDDQR
jgi:hypothetical protein